MKKKNRKLSGWVRRKADRAYLRLWNHTRTRQWMHPCRIISLSLALCLLSSFALAQEDTNHTLAASEAVNALAELPGNPFAHLATKADLANLEVRLAREIADLRTEVKTEIIQRTAGLPNRWDMWLATAVLLLGMLSILVSLFVLYRQGRGRA